MTRFTLSLILLLALFCPAFAYEQPDPVFNVLSDDLPYPPNKAYSMTEIIYEKRKVIEAYDQWLEQAWGGDIRAFIRLGPTIQGHPDLDWPIPASFWEEWVIALLGEREGYYLLGLNHKRLARSINPYSKELAEQYFLKSAAAGHLDGMYAAFFTGEDRTGPFIPPEADTDISVSKECMPKATFTDEQVYWSTRAANMGHAKSAMFIAVGCWDDASSQQAYELGERYFHEASGNGATTATNYLLKEHYEPRHHIKPDVKNFLYYCFLNSRYYELGNLPVEAHEEAVDMAKQSNALKTQALSLTKDDIQAAVEQSRITYTTWQQNQAAALAAKHKLYAEAMARMPEVKKAYDQAKNK